MAALDGDDSQSSRASRPVLPGGAGQAGSHAGRALAWLARVLSLDALVTTLEQERARWFPWVAVLLGLGIGIYFALPFEPSLLAAVLLAAISLSLWLSLRGGVLMPLVAASLCAVSLGFLAAKVRAAYVASPVLSEMRRAAVVVGTVELAEPRPKRGQRLTLRVIRIEGLEPARTPRRVRIRAMTIDQALVPGDVVRVRASLQPPAGPALPGGYDFARAAWFAGLGATGYSLQAPELFSEAQEEWWGGFWSGVEGVRQDVGARISSAVPGETGAIATSLITGERGGISDETTDIYRDSGLVHILSISGLHMAIVAGAIFGSIRLAFALVPALALRFAIKKWAALFACLAAGAYLLLSGCAVATVRSYLMISLMFLAIMLERPALSMRNVAISALIILIVTPESILDAGFQMSYAAVVGLVAVYEFIRLRSKGASEGPGAGPLWMFLGGIAVSTLIASITVAPFGAYHFHRSQQYALLANVVAVPICNLVVMPAALLTLALMPFGLEAIPLAVMAWGIETMTGVARWVAALPGAVAHVPAMSEHAFLCMVFGGLWLALWQSRWRLLGIGLVALGLLLAIQVQRPDVLIGVGGRLVAARGADGALAAIVKGRADYELTRWLESDGDSRDAKAVRAQTLRRARCDGVGCVLAAGARSVSIAYHPAALRDDCAYADILVRVTRAPGACSAPQLIVDAEALRRGGAHAVYFDAVASAGFRVETANARRGARPWVQPTMANGRSERAALQSGGGPAAPSAAAPVVDTPTRAKDRDSIPNYAPFGDEPGESEASMGALD